MADEGATFYYSYDASDALVKKGTDPYGLGADAFLYDELGQLQTSRPSDPDSSTIDTTAYRYDPAGHLTCISTSGDCGSADTARTTFAIDALGRQTSKTAGTADPLTYAYLGTSQQVSSSAASGVLSAYSAIDAIGNRGSTGTSAQQAYLIADLHGNVAASIGTGSSPSYLSAYRYDPYGQTLDSYSAANPVQVPFRFGGRILQSAEGATDLYDFGARSYDPSLGVFTTFDSVSGGVQNPLTLNRYLYALANPATLIDPDGHWGFDPFTVITAVASAPVVIASAPIIVVGGVVYTTEAAIDYVQPGFQSSVVEPLGSEAKTVWSAVSSPFAAIQGAGKGEFDGLRDMAAEALGSIDGLSRTAAGCVTGQPCNMSDLPRIDVPGAIASAQNEAGYVWNNFTGKVNAGDWHGAGADVGHAGLAVGQLAALGGIARAGLRALLARLEAATTRANIWDGYLDEWVPRPEGPLVAVEGDAYTAAERLPIGQTGPFEPTPGVWSQPCSMAWRSTRSSLLAGGGSPTSLDNKIALPEEIHDQVTAFWARFGRR